MLDRSVSVIYVTLWYSLRASSSEQKKLSQTTWYPFLSNPASPNSFNKISAPCRSPAGLGSSRRPLYGSMWTTCLKEIMKIHKRCYIIYIYIYMMFILLLLLSFFVFVFFSNKNCTTSTSYHVELSARHQNFTPNLDVFVGINIRMTLRHLVPTSVSSTAMWRRGV